jgi:hypothetical protein
MIQTKDITHRHVAVMLCKSLPVEGDDFGRKVNEYLEAIKSLPKAARIALRSAYIFSRKVPKQEREDLFQDIAATIWEANIQDEKLAYAVARCDWQDWWKRYSIRQHYSLDTVIEDSEGNPATLAELLVGEAEFERKMNGKLDAHRIWQQLPDKIKPIINRRLLGQVLNPNERKTLSRWIQARGYQLLLQNSS